MKNQILFLALMLTIFSCVREEKNDRKEELPLPYAQNIENLISFFDQNAWNDSLEVYYSDLDNRGNLLSEKVYLVALSRLVYGLSYSSTFYPENLQKAEKSVAFQLENLVGKEEKVGKYFIPYIEQGIKDSPQSLDIWQQAYGLCGLSEYYRQNPNPVLLETIHELHDNFIERFYDKKHGGFFSNYQIEGRIQSDKTLQSLMYPITAYMANLCMADVEHQEKYVPFIKENLALLKKYGWNENTNWVNVKFQDDWNVCKTEDVSKPCFTVTLGHNFQLASLFLRAKDFTFLSKEESGFYYKQGVEMLEATLQKKTFVQQSLTEGFYSEFNPYTDESLDKRKTWWQYAEAIIALSLVENETYTPQLEELLHFFLNHFSDKKYGGEYFYLAEDNSPITTEQKGSIGKSIYHTVEMIRFLVDNEKIGKTIQ